MFLFDLYLFLCYIYGIKKVRDGGVNMAQVTLGKTGITVNKNGFGALPIQRISQQDAVYLLHKAFEHGIRFFDTARGYTNSEEKLGVALKGIREQVFVATKTPSKTAEGFWKDLETSLHLLQTDYIDIYQFHNPDFCPKPGDGSGLYEAMLEAQAQGKIRFIGITNHRLAVAHEAIASGLYATLQFPFSYLSTAKELELVEACAQQKMGFIAMKGLSGGLLNNAEACYAFMQEHPDVVPIWGIQRPEELEQWLGFFRTPASLTPELRSFIEKERGELTGEFCRGCGYCLPCPAGIQINQCARISLMIRRAPSESWLAPAMQAEMEKIEHCLGCGQCKSRCPYELDTPNLLKRNLADYRRILAGEVSTDSYLRPAQK